MVVGIEASRILLVEDDPNDVELMRLSLENYNFVNQIDVVSDGEQALNYLLGQNGLPPSQPLPRLVLLDLKLPRIGGLQVIETLRNHPRTRNVVIVVMTSSAEDRDLEACYNLRINSYVVKPVDFQQFLDAARHIGFYWMMLNQIPQSLIQG
jgi:two-component system, response regulator